MKHTMENLNAIGMQTLNSIPGIGAPAAMYPIMNAPDLSKIKPIAVQNGKDGLTHSFTELGASGREPNRSKSSAVSGVDKYNWEEPGVESGVIPVNQRRQ